MNEFRYPLTLALLIPAYNAAAYLPRLLKSAGDQSEPFDEVWIYDDCSSDGTAEIAAQYGANVVRSDINRGCTWGKSALVERTECDWVHFHDADDLLRPNFVVTARRWIEDDSADVVIFGCEERWENTEEPISVSVPNDGLLVADAIGYTISHKINAISGLYRRASFLTAGGFDLDAEVLFNEDQACHCKLARAGLRFRGDDKALVVNLRRSSSMWTANEAKCIRAHFKVMQKALADVSGAAHSEAIAERLWHVVAGAAAHLDWETADKAAALAMKLGGPTTAPAGRLFQAICQVSPIAAVRIREWLIRCLKPKIRARYPGWRSPIGLF